MHSMILLIPFEIKLLPVEKSDANWLRTKMQNDLCEVCWCCGDGQGCTQSMQRNQQQNSYFNPNQKEKKIIDYIIIISL